MGTVVSIPEGISRDLWELTRHIDILPGECPREVCGSFAMLAVNKLIRRVENQTHMWSAPELTELDEFLLLSLEENFQKVEGFLDCVRDRNDLARSYECHRNLMASLFDVKKNADILHYKRRLEKTTKRIKKKVYAYTKRIRADIPAIKSLHDAIRGDLIDLMLAYKGIDSEWP